MLALLFRSVFLVGVIGWYSASLWKAVDNYFKGQFQRYLDEEYQRNPRMRDDVRAYTTVDKAASDVIAQKLAQKLAQISCGEEDVCPIDKADLAYAAALPREVKSQGISVPGDSGAGAAAAEIEVARPAAHTDQQPAFHDSPVDEAAVPPLQTPSSTPSPQAIRNYKIVESSRSHGEIEQAAEVIAALEQKQPREVKKEVPKKVDETQSSPARSRKKSRAKKKPKIEATSEVPTKAKIKQGPKILTLKLTEDDFEEASRFFEFDYEDDERDFVDHFEDDNEDFNGILLKDLPFKPMIDVYDLERVSEEEYCPLSLDDDPTCDELRSWP